jgi:hypothetical protein
MTKFSKEKWNEFILFGTSTYMPYIIFIMFALEISLILVLFCIYCIIMNE